MIFLRHRGNLLAALHVERCCLTKHFSIRAHQHAKFPTGSLHLSWLYLARLTFVKSRVCLHRGTM